MPALIVNAVPAVETGSAISFNQVSRLVGYATGSALSAIVLQSATHRKSGLPGRAPQKKSTGSADSAAESDSSPESGGKSAGS